MFLADLHVHSKYSRATSRDADLEHMAVMAQQKGLSVIGTGDFTHPLWMQEIRDKLIPAEPGLFRLRSDLQSAVNELVPPACREPVRFLLEVETSTIYRQSDHTRKVHHLIYAPNLEQAEIINQRLGRIGNLKADGRPILGMSSRDLLEVVLNAGEHCFLIPAHVWTPWFAALGSKSGFDSIDECYGDLAEHIFAIETGLSSDPAMNWRLSQLDRFTQVSNSDAHSPPKLGREATAFDCPLDYFAMRDALRTRRGFGGTVEFFPEEGKYHLDGHRACAVRLEPSDTRRHHSLCPVCRRELTVGVLHRVQSLADRPDGFRPPDAAACESLIPLPEVLSEITQTGEKSKRVQTAWQQVVQKLGPELTVLREVPLEDIRHSGASLLAEAIGRMRRGQVHREAGYDGEHGTIRVFDPGELPSGRSVFE